MNSPIDPRAVLAPKATRSGAEDRRSPPAADSASAPVLFIRDEMMLAAVRAGMPGKDAMAAANNALQAFMGDVEESVEARAKLSSYRYDPAHARAMLAALEVACRSHAAERLRRQEAF